MKQFRFVLVVLLLAVFVFTSQASSADKVMLARIHLADKSQMKEIPSLHLDVAYVQYGQYVDIVTDQDEVDHLRSLGYEVEIVHEDLVAFYRSRLDLSKDMG
jgi:negative regulator of sigma E activity